MNFVQIEQFYRDIYNNSSNVYSRYIDAASNDETSTTTTATEVIDDLLPHEIQQSIQNFMITLNPPPDTLMKLRATVFKVASQYVQEQFEQNDSRRMMMTKSTLSLLLRQMQGIVQMIHTTFYTTKGTLSDRIVGGSDDITPSSVDTEEEIRSFLNQLLLDNDGDGMTLDSEDNERLLSFLRKQAPIVSERLFLSLVFSIGQEHLQSDGNSNRSSSTAHSNEQVFRCMNVMVHAMETVFYQPKPYRLQLSSTSSTGTSAASSYSAMTAAGRTNHVSGNDGETTTTTSTTIADNYHNNSPQNHHPPMDLLTSMTLNDAVQQLWNYDANRLVMNDDLYLNVQNGKKPYHKEDAAMDPLFTKVDPNVFRRSTYAAFVHLLDNYHSVTGVSEQVTSLERKEIDHFLSIILETAPMQFCYQYCQAHNVLGKTSSSSSSSHRRNDHDDDEASSMNEFKELLYTIWFEPYSRDGNQKDSSGFEHVFIGEVEDNAISGFHNWIQFYHQEQKGNIDYRGYIKPRGTTPSQRRSSESNRNYQSDDHLLTLQFAWKNSGSNTYVEKFVGTMFIGVSPEFEMALYTMCFLFGHEENTLSLDTGADVYEVVIKCYTIARGKIGTTFPEVVSHFDDNED
jgi:poly(U)-specific endoribonuclease